MKTFPLVKQTLRQAILSLYQRSGLQQSFKSSFIGCLTAVFLLFSQAIYAQALAWELSAEPGNQASSTANVVSPNFNATLLTRGVGLTPSAAAGCINSSAWFSSASPTTLADAIANNDYYEFTVSTSNCLFFNPTTIQIVLRSSNTGPNTATLRCSSDGFTTDIGTVTVTTASVQYTFSETVSPNSSSVVYRLYGYGNAANTGSTPGTGGTMRIGTSVNAPDNDLSVFATSTNLILSSVSNITVNAGNVVPATVFSANVPGAVVGWSRTNEAIGLPSNSGTGDVPSFTATNNTGAPLTSTFSAVATVGSCNSVPIQFTITVNPPACTITATFLGNPSACNDNGTPNDPNDDFFTQNIQATFFNRPTTGSLQIVPGGDEIGTYSIPVQNIVGNSHIFSGVKFKADGTPTNVQMNFTDEPTCIDAAVGPTVQPCSTPPPACTITATFLGNPSACNDNGTPNNPNDDFFTQNIQATFFNRPTTGNLQIVPGGDQIGTYSIPVQNIVGNSHIFNNVMFKADGTPTNIQMNFTADPTCIDAATGPTVNSCSAGSPCEVIGFSFANISSCNDNGTPGDPSDDYFTVNVDVLYSNSTQGDSIILEGGDVVLRRTTLAQTGTNLTTTLTAVRFRADGQAVDFTGKIGMSSNIHCSLPGTGPAVNSCSNAPPCSISSVVVQNVGPCNDNGTPNNLNDDFFTANVVVVFVNPPATGNLEIELPGDVVPGGGATSVPVAGLTSPHTFTGVRFKADGTVTVVEVQFSANQGCVRTGTGPTVQPCSVPCSISSVTFQNIGPCSDNGTNNNTNDDFFTADVRVVFSNPITTGNLEIELPGDVVPGGGATSVSVVGLTSPHVFTGVRFKADNTATVVEVQFSDDQSCVRTATGPTVQSCSFPAPVLTCPVPVTVSCIANVAPPNPASVGETHTCPGAVSITHVGDVNSNVTCINRLTITRTYQATDLCGNTSTCTQTITVNDQTPPTVTCPVNVTVNCAANIAPVDLNALGVTDNCAGTLGITKSFLGEVITNQTCPNRFTLTRTYRGGDACGNTATCNQVITVNNQNPVIVPPNGASQVACPALIVTPTPPAVNSACGQPITPTGPVITNSPNPITCEGTRTFTFTYTDCEGNTAQWSHVTTVERQPFTINVPNGASTVACPSQIVTPAPPTVISNCGEVLTPTGPVIVNNPNPITCEGTRTFTWTFTDCEGNTAQWSHVTTVERQPFTIPAPNGNATVACPDQTDTQPIPPVVTSNCGEVLVPVVSASAKPGCEGDRLYTFHYTDCEGNTADWFFHYHVEYLDFAVPANEVVNVECPSNVIVPTPPIVFDNCGKQLTPTGPVVTSQSNAQGCETNRQYVFTYKDCEGNTHTWSKTFNFSLSSDYFVYPDQEDYVACLAYAQVPVPPTIYDNCGREIVVTLTSTTENVSASGCSGWRKFVFTYTDCGGNNRTWSYTYIANDDQPPVGDCVSGSVDVTNLACIEDVPCPDDYDFGSKMAELLAEGNIYDECSGNNLVVELDSWSALWQCSDPNGDGVNTFGRTFYFRIADECGNEMPSLCSVTYSGVCLPIETFPQSAWGITGDEPGSDQSADTTDLQVITTLLNQGPLVVGGSHRSITLTSAQCVVDLLPGVGYPTILANCQQVNCGGCNPAGTIGMKNKLAANTIALTLNMRFNVLYNHLLMNAVRAQRLDCIDIDDDIKVCTNAGVCKLLIWETNGTPHEFPYTVGGLLDLANLYLDGGFSLSVGNNLVIADGLNISIENVNANWHQSSFVASCDTEAGITKPSMQPDKALPKQKIVQAEMRLMPNPANREVRFELAKLAERQTVSLEFYNLYGQMVLRRDFGKVASVSERIELDGLGTGVYFVRVKAGNEHYQQKLFITRD